MNITVKKEELILLISSYLKSEISVNRISDFIWEIIDYFTKNKNNLPPYNEVEEKSFWYAIWQLQHLCGEEHENDETFAKELTQIVIYLKNQQPLPKFYQGKRPTD